MTKRQENIRLKKYEEHLEEVAKPSRDAIDLFVKYVKREVKDFMNSMMYREKPKKKLDRFLDNVAWWLKILAIYFFLEGITYKLTGR